LELKERGAVRAEVTVASLIEQAEFLLQKAVELSQISAAVGALREKATIAGLRVERAEKGQPGAFDKLSDAELDALFVAEYERPKALPALNR